LKAFKVFETQNFERGADPKDSMKLGDVKGRLLKKYRKEAIQAIEEVVNTYGGDGPYFIDKEEENEIKLSSTPSGFKIALYREDPIQSRFKISEDKVRYYIEYNAEARAFHADTRALFVGWEQFDIDGKWRDRQWTGVIPYRIEGMIRTSGDIETIEEAKLILIDYIQSNKPLEGPINNPE
jgi:hypothetical protein